MHEYSITFSILEILRKVIKEKNISKIKKINFEISPITHIEPHSIEFYFKFLTEKDDILKDSKLIFKETKIKAECRDCKKVFELENFTAKCPTCSGKRIKIRDTDDIKIISVEV